MAFPVVTADSQSGTVTVNATNWTLTYPTNLVSGELIVAFLGHDGPVSTVSFPAGWTNSAQGAAACTVVTAYKFSDGTETGGFTVTLGAAEQGAWRTYRITGAHASTAPETATVATANNSAPDPPSFDPAGWASEDTLWWAVWAADNSVVTTAWPTSYTSGDSLESGGGTGASLATSRRELAATSDDPGTGTLFQAERWQAVTFAIRPAAGAAPTPSLLPVPPPLHAMIGR